MIGAKDDLKRRVREASNLADVVRSYGLELKRAGRYLKACCPFHNEKTPSFHVQPEGEYFKCFGCGKSGDVFSFVMFQERVEFPEALRILADRAGIPVQIDPQAAAQYRKETDWKGYLYRLNGVAAAFYREMLFTEAGRPAREYLQRRGLSEESWERFELGFAPPNGSPLLQRLQGQRAPMRAIERAGLVGLREDGTAYDYFRGRVMFPIHDSQGRTIGFGGRVLDDSEPKYLNTRETPLFTKGRTIYGLSQARDSMVASRRAVLVEGYTDVIMCHQHGVQNVVACLGTAVTTEHVRGLRRLADELLLLTDSDAAGARASERGLEVLFQEDIGARVVRLPGGDKDPCDFLIHVGREPFEEALTQGVSLFDYKFQAVARSHDLAAPDGQARAARELMALVSLSPDPTKRAAYRREVAGRLNLPESALELAPVRAPAAEKQDEAGFAEGPPRPEHPLAHAERELLRWVFHEPAWLESLVAEVDLTALVGRCERRVGCAILQAMNEGRLPPDPQALAAAGGTPAGSVAREVLARISEGSGEREELEEEGARGLCIALAEDASEHARLKADEVYGILVEALHQARAEHDLESAKRMEAAARASGDPAALEAAAARVRDLRKASKKLKRPVVRVV